VGNKDAEEIFLAGVRGDPREKFVSSRGDEVGELFLGKEFSVAIPRMENGWRRNLCSRKNLLTEYNKINWKVHVREDV
jgi:hypothetical protein